MSRKVIAKFSNDYKSSIDHNNYIRNIELESEDYCFDKRQILASSSHDSILLIDYTATPRLVLFLYEYSCQPCMDSLFKCLKQVFGSDSNAIAIMGSKEGMKAIQLNRDYFNVDYPIYYFVDHELNISANKQGYSFLCLIDQHLRTKFVYIPDKGDMQNTLSYLKFIKKKFLV